MTKNEIIARWLGKRVFERGQHQEAKDGDLVHDEECGFLEVDDGCLLPWSPEDQITLWHGEDGLLAEIEKRKKGEWSRTGYDLVAEFVCGVRDITEDPKESLQLPGFNTSIIMLILRATPARLAAALVQVIYDSMEEEADWDDGE